MRHELARKKRIIAKELAEIKRLIKREFPDATFRVTEGAEPESRTLWMDVYTDMADGDNLSDLVVERQVQLLIHRAFLLSINAMSRLYLHPRVTTNGKEIRFSSRARALPAGRVRAIREKTSDYRTVKKTRGKK